MDPVELCGLQDFSMNLGLNESVQEFVELRRRSASSERLLLIAPRSTRRVPWLKTIGVVAYTSHGIPFEDRKSATRATGLRRIATGCPDRMPYFPRLSRSIFFPEEEHFYFLSACLYHVHIYKAKIACVELYTVRSSLCRTISWLPSLPLARLAS